MTLLQCLAIQPTALTPRRAHRAISSCLSALAIYARMLPSVSPFLHLFEMLSDLFVRNDHASGEYPMGEVRRVLNKIVSSDPSETSGYDIDIYNQSSCVLETSFQANQAGARFLRSLSNPDTRQGMFDLNGTENTVRQQHPYNIQVT